MKLIILVIIGAGILLYRPFFNTQTNTITAVEEKQLQDNFTVNQVGFTDSSFDFGGYSAGSFLLKCLMK